MRDVLADRDGDLWISVPDTRDFACVTREGLDPRPLRQVADDFGPIRRALWEAVYVASAPTRHRLTVLESICAGEITGDLDPVDEYKGMDGPAL